jgi:hypothetical protein
MAFLRSELNGFLYRSGQMSRSIVRPVKIIVVSAFAWALCTSLGASATITQATVATNSVSQTFDFEIIWNSAPDFSTTDSFKYNILNPSTASSCCNPYSGWSGFAAFDADYQVIENAGAISFYSGNDLGRTLIGTIPFTLTGNVLDFAIAFSSLIEPNGFVYELERYVSGAWDGNLLVGSADGNPATVPGVPLPAALPLFASGLGVLSLFCWRRKRAAAFVAT